MRKYFAIKVPVIHVVKKNSLQIILKNKQLKKLFLKYYFTFLPIEIGISILAIFNET